MTELDPTGLECVSFTVSADWAHFRRIDTTIDKQTYRVPPRTTVAGLVAAILGLPRDSYYDLFGPEQSAMAIECLTPVETMQIPILTVPTTENDISSAENLDGKLVKPEAMAAQRQRRSFEYLCDARYRIHLILNDTDVRTDLIERLSAGRDVDRIRPVYTPCLGKTECLADLTDTEVTTVSAGGTDEKVDSIVPEEAMQPETEVAYALERTPAFMTTDGGGRKTTEYLSYVYPKEGGSLSVTGIETHVVSDSHVVFI